MTPRERVLRAIAHQPVDKMPVDYWATGEVTNRLKQHFGVQRDVELWECLHLDKIVAVGPKYVGPALPVWPDGRRQDVWGVVHVAQDYGDGVYWEMVSHPLAQAETFADVDAYEFPHLDWFDFAGIPAAIAGYSKYAIEGGYSAPFYYFNRLVGLEASLLMMAEKPQLAKYIIDKIVDWFLAYHTRLFAAGGGGIHLTQVTDDFGSQHGLLISKRMFYDFFADHYARLIALAKQYGIKVFHHDDGACRELLPDLIALGIDILNPVQWKCPGMDRAELKAEFGRQICFHGGVDNQEILPFGSPAAVRSEVRACIDLLGPDTGYILAPCHNIQPVTPIENIIALYDEAFSYGQRQGG